MDKDTASIVTTSSLSTSAPIEASIDALPVENPTSPGAVTDRGRAWEMGASASASVDATASTTSSMEATRVSMLPRGVKDPSMEEEPEGGGGGARKPEAYSFFVI